MKRIHIDDPEELAMSILAWLYMIFVYVILVILVLHAFTSHAKEGILNIPEAIWAYLVYVVVNHWYVKRFINWKYILITEISLLISCITIIFSFDSEWTGHPFVWLIRLIFKFLSCGIV